MKVDLQQLSTEELITELTARGWTRYVPMAADVEVHLRNPQRKDALVGHACEALVRFKEDG